MLGASADAATAVDPPLRERPIEAPALEDAARAREEEAEEDPLTKRQQSIRLEAETTPAETPAKEPNALAVYGSLRVRYRATSDRQGIEDGSSRVGIQGRYQFLPQRWLSLRGEAGFKLLDEVSALANGNSPSGGRGDSFFPRLHYLSYESPNLFLVLGKTWSVYYKVTSFTDRFAGTGGQAAGTYNAGTDGGRTGTGRAEDALQTRVQLDLLPRLLGFEPLSLNVQLQNGQAIPDAWGAHYGLALGVSTSWRRPTISRSASPTTMRRSPTTQTQPCAASAFTAMPRHSRSARAGWTTTGTWAPSSRGCAIMRPRTRAATLTDAGGSSTPSAASLDAGGAPWDGTGSSRTADSRSPATIA